MPGTLFLTRTHVRTGVKSYDPDTIQTPNQPEPESSLFVAHRLDII